MADNEEIARLGITFDSSAAKAGADDVIQKLRAVADAADDNATRMGTAAESGGSKWKTAYARAMAAIQQSIPETFAAVQRVDAAGKTGAQQGQSYADAFLRYVRNAAAEAQRIWQAQSAAATSAAGGGGAGGAAGIAGLLTKAEVTQAAAAYDVMYNGATKVATSSTSAFAGLGRVRQGLISLVSQLTGTVPVLDRIGGSLLTFAAGTATTLGIVAGIAAIAFAYDKLTESSREATRAQEASIAALEKLHHDQTVGAAGDLLKQVRDAQAALDKARANYDADVARQVAAATARSAGPRGAVPTDIQQQIVAATARAKVQVQQNIDDLQSAVDAGNRKLRQMELADAQEQARTSADLLAQLIQGNNASAAERRRALALETDYKHQLASLTSVAGNGDATNTQQRNALIEMINTLDQALNPVDKHLQTVTQHITEQNQAAAALGVTDQARIAQAQRLVVASDQSAAAYERERKAIELENQFLTEQARIIKLHSDANGQMRAGEQATADAEIALAKQRLTAEQAAEDHARSALALESDTHVIDVLKAKIAAYGDSKQAVKDATIEEEYRTRVLAAESAADATQQKLLLDRAATIRDLEYQEHAAATAAQDRTAAQRKAAEEAKQQATAARDTVKNFVREVQQDFANFFASILDGGVNSFRALVDEIRRLFDKLLADLIAKRIGQRLFSSNSGSLGGLGSLLGVGGGGGGVGGATASGETAGLSGGLFSFGSDVLAPGAGGFAVGYGIGSTTTNSTLGALGGAASGAAVGAMIAGPVGAIVGGVAGLVGGLIGSANKLKQLRAQFQQDEEAFITKYTGSQNSYVQQLTQINADYQKLLDEAKKAKRSVSGDAESAYVEGIARIQAGFVDGLTQQLATYGTVADQTIAQQAAIEKAYQDNLDAAKQLGLGESALEQIEALRTAQLNALAKQQADALTQATDDLAVRKLAAQGDAERSAMLALLLQQQQELTTAETDGRSAAYLATLKNVQALEREAKAKDLATQATQAAITAAEQQVQALSQVIDTLTTYRNSLAFGTNSPANPIDQLGAARTQLQSLYQRALAGDQTAASQIPGLADQFLQLSHSVNASGTGYVSDYTLVTQILDDLTGKFGDQKTIAEQQLEEAQKQTALLEQQYEAMLDQLAQLTKLAVAATDTGGARDTHGGGVIGPTFGGTGTSGTSGSGDSGTGSSTGSGGGSGRGTGLLFLVSPAALLPSAARLATSVGGSTAAGAQQTAELRTQTDEIRRQTRVQGAGDTVLAAKLDAIVDRLDRLERTTRRGQTGPAV